MSRIIIKIAVLFLSLLFILTGLAKAAAIGQFSSALLREVPLSELLSTTLAISIVAAEILSGAGLLFRRTQKLAALVLTLLLLIFLIVLFRKFMQGGDLQCDCFGVFGIRPPLGFHIGLDLGLAFIALLLAFRPGVAVTRAPSRRVSRFVIVVVAVLGGGVILAFLSALQSPAHLASPIATAAEAEMTFPVKATTAHRAPLVKGISCSGIVRPFRMVELVPRVSGEIVAVNGYDGKEVTKGEVLASIDERAFRLGNERAASALLAAQIEYRTLTTSSFLHAIDTMQARLHLQAAREHYQRVRTAYAAGKISGPAFNRARREYEVTRAYLSVNREDVIANRCGLAQAREAYERARLELESTQIRAPFSGRIAEWNATVGMQARIGQPICSLVDASRILIDVDVIEGEADKVHAGDKVTATCVAFPGIGFQGTVRTVSPTIDPRSGMMRITAELSQPGSRQAGSYALFRPGMYASVLIETECLEGRLLVPREALLMRDLRQLVFTARNGLAKWNYVETGDENRELIEIRSGISEGDTVLVEGHQMLAHDARVDVQD
jgi:RND family efflux transporter MFP subunit